LSQKILAVDDEQDVLRLTQFLLEPWGYVDVKDTGLGIPRETIPRLFERFYRVRCDDRKDIIGAGLGLSLVKQIIDGHAGEISAESEHGVGSTFTFSLPIKAKETMVEDPATAGEFFTSDQGEAETALKN
jgi:signal transduction histidine kinase